MSILESLKLTNPMWRNFEKNVCNIDCVLINNNREHQKAFRNDDDITYIFFEKVRIKVGDIFVDSRGRLNIIKAISNTKTMEKDNQSYCVVYATTERYENPTGIFKLFNEQSIRDNYNITLTASGDIIVNGAINNNSKITLSVFSRIDISSAWEAIKSDLYNLYDYENYRALINYVEELRKSNNDEKSEKDNRGHSRFDKFLLIAKKIAGPLGTFVGSAMAAFYQGINQ